jgi:hypothetical protein
VFESRRGHHGLSEGFELQKLHVSYRSLLENSAR